MISLPQDKVLQRRVRQLVLLLNRVLKRQMAPSTYAALKALRLGFAALRQQDDPAEREALMPLEIQFIGAVGTVTGSKTLLDDGKTRVLVDCGLFQGLKVLRARNWEPLPVDPRTIDAVVLTHAHLDHSGYLPLLVREGFAGPIVCTPPTEDLANILLPDAGHLMEEDARHANKHSYTKHEPALPLYTVEDAQRVAGRFHALGYDRPFSVGDFSIRLDPVGHILGAARARITWQGRELLFSGDIGRPEDVLTPRPDLPAQAEWIAMESTYGGRVHTPVEPIAAVAEVVRRAVERGGVLLVPAFAVGRTQAMLLCLHEAFERGLAPRVPVYVNSPMATSVTELYERHDHYHTLNARQVAEAFDVATYVRSIEGSKSLNGLDGPAVVISASGMMTGGRVLHHLKAMAPNPRNTILLTGYQAPGTRGATLLEGAQQLKIHGAYVPIRAAVEQIDFLSAHADQPELLDWLRALGATPRKVFLLHGEPNAAEAMRLRIKEDLGLKGFVPDYLQRLRLA